LIGDDKFVYKTPYTPDALSKLPVETLPQYSSDLYLHCPAVEVVNHPYIGPRNRMEKFNSRIPPPHDFYRFDCLDCKPYGDVAIVLYGNSCFTNVYREPIRDPKSDIPHFLVDHAYTYFSLHPEKVGDVVQSHRYVCAKIFNPDVKTTDPAMHACIQRAIV
jgi:hypothetical protein